MTSKATQIDVMRVLDPKAKGKGIYPGDCMPIYQEVYLVLEFFKLGW